MGRTPFDSGLETTLYVATDRAVREGRPMKVCRHERLGWTVVPAEKRCEPGYEPLVAVGPGDHTDAARRKIVDLIQGEHPMGAAKRIYTARQTRQPIAVGVLRAFGAAPPLAEPKRAGDDLPGAITAHETASRYGPTPPVAYTDPPPDNDDAERILAAAELDYCTLCGGPAEPCKSLCVKVLAGCEPQPSPGSPTMPQDTPAPVAGPYPPSPSATRHKRSQKAPAKGQKSLFD